MRWMEFCLTIVCVSFGAHAEQVDSSPRFEVASVKLAGPPSRSRGRNGGGPGTSDPGLIRYERVTLKGLLQRAYNVEADRINGAQWMATDAFAIEAKAPPGATKDQVPGMIQNLLRDRFHLVLHTETTNFATYELVLAKGGPKMKRSSGESAGPADSTKKEPDQPLRMTLTKNAEGFPVLPAWAHYQAAHSNGVERASYRDISLAEFAKTLQFDAAPTLGDPFSPLRIVDRTGLAGTFDFTLEFSPKPDTSVSDSPDLFYALEKQLGLHLQKGEWIPLDVLVIDHADRTPTEN